MHLIKYMLATLLVSLAALNVAWAAPEFKVGFVDLQKALALSKAGKEAKESYEDEVQDAQAELDKKKDAFQDLRKKFEKQRSSLSETALAERQEELIQLEKDLKRSFQDSEAKLRRRNQQIVTELLVQIRKVVDEVGKSKDFTVILEKSSDAVLYADSSIDLTEEVVSAFNEETR